jgi:hypothetical protein
MVNRSCEERHSDERYETDDLVTCQNGQFPEPGEIHHPQSTQQKAARGGGFHLSEIGFGWVQEYSVKAAVAADDAGDISTENAEISKFAVGKAAKFVFGTTVCVAISQGAQD